MPPLVVDVECVQRNSRLTGVRLAMLMLRSMEIWRRMEDNSDRVLVIAAVAAIIGERFTRGETIDEQHRDLRHPFPQEELQDCNISSIAAATGFNRETTRRKVKELIDEGILVRTGRGMVRFQPGFTQQPIVSEVVRREVESIVRFINEIARDDLVREM